MHLVLVESVFWTWFCQSNDNSRLWHSFPRAVAVAVAVRSKLRVARFLPTDWFKTTWFQTTSSLSLSLSLSLPFQGLFVTFKMIFSSSILESTPLANLSLPLQILVISILTIVLSVAFNVFKQKCLPRDPSLPPLVFHYFPIIGSAVTYGMDPYTFFEKNRELVSLGSNQRDKWAKLWWAIGNKVKVDVWVSWHFSESFSRKKRERQEMARFGKITEPPSEDFLFSRARRFPALETSLWRERKLSWAFKIQ